MTEGQKLIEGAATNVADLPKKPCGCGGTDAKAPCKCIPWKQLGFVAVFGAVAFGILYGIGMLLSGSEKSAE